MASALALDKYERVVSNMIIWQAENMGFLPAGDVLTFICSLCLVYSWRTILLFALALSAQQSALCALQRGADHLQLQPMI